jgi:hypothetical protein
LILAAITLDWQCDDIIVLSAVAAVLLVAVVVFLVKEAKAQTITSIESAKSS